MQPIPWYLTLLISIPQTILMIKLGFALFNFRISNMHCLLVSLGVALASYFFRKFQIPFEANTFVLIIIIIGLTSLVSRIKIRYCVLSVLLGFMIYGVIETILLPLFLRVLDISFAEFLLSPQLNILAFMPMFLITLFIYYLSRRFNIVLFDFGGKEHDFE